MSMFAPYLIMQDIEPAEPISLDQIRLECGAWFQCAADMRRSKDYEMVVHCTDMAGRYARVLRMLDWAPRGTRQLDEVAA